MSVDLDETQMGLMGYVNDLTFLNAGSEQKFIKKHMWSVRMQTAHNKQFWNWLEN